MTTVATTESSDVHRRGFPFVGKEQFDQNHSEFAPKYPFFIAIGKNFP